MRFSHVFIGLGLVLAMASCTSSSDTPVITGGSGLGGSGGGGPVSATVSLTSINQFDPPEVTIKTGESVKWVWKGGFHDVVSGTKCAPDGKFSNGKLDFPPADYAFTFTQPGTYDYYCTPHCTMGMVGKVIVQAPK